MGWDDAAYIAATAATSAYSANQANQASTGNAYTANLTNMVSQVQNQDFNAREAERTRAFNSDEAQWNREFQSAEAGTTRNYNAAEAQKARDFQEMMGNTQYQRAVGDMKAAGLNPMLAYKNGGAGNVSGSAASVGAPSGGAASGGQASSGSAPRAEVPTFTTSFGAMNSALDIRSRMAQVEQMEAQTDNIRAQTPGVHADSEGKQLNVDRLLRNYDLFIKGDAWDQLSKGEQNEILQIKKELDRANKNTESTESWQGNRQLIQSAEQLSKEYGMRGDALDMTRRRAESGFYGDTGEASKFINSAGALAPILNALRGFMAGGKR